MRAKSRSFDTWVNISLLSVPRDEEEGSKRNNLFGFDSHPYTWTCFQTDGFVNEYKPTNTTFLQSLR